MDQESFPTKGDLFLNQLPQYLHKLESLCWCNIARYSKCSAFLRVRIIRHKGLGPVKIGRLDREERPIYLRLYIAVAIIQLLTGSIASARPSSELRLDATIRFESVFDNRDDFKSQWNQFCENFGKNLLINQHGFLTTFTCMSLTHTHAKESDWDILFTENADGLQVRVKQNRKDGVAISKTYEFPTYGQVLPHLTGRILPLAMSRLLIESLPFGMAFKVNGKSVFFPRSNDLPPHSKELIVYGLRFDEKSQLWMPKIYAYLKRLEPLDGDKAIQGDEYEWTENRKPLEKNKIYWAQDSQGLGQRSADYEVVINKLLHKSAGSGSNFMSQIFFESFRSSYTGIRFGKSLLGSGSIVTEGNLVSGLVEIRGGPLTGLRSYYDIVPLVSRNEGSEEEHFSLKRASIGWCFSALMPKSYRFLLSSVDVQPKLGLLDIDSRFRINPEESDSALSFKAKNIYDLALEFGIERSSLYYRTRLWASIDAAPSVLSAKQGLSVLSTRAGLDSYINIFESRGGGNVNILAFALAENLALTKERVNANEDEDLAVSKLKFQLFFVGLGFTVSW